MVSKLKPFYYASLLGMMREVAQELGYALALHGSMVRDLDLIAVPWVEEAADPEVLVEAIRVQLGGFTRAIDNLPQVKAHGRLGWIIWLDAEVFIDLSITPRLTVAS